MFPESKVTPRFLNVSVGEISKKLSMEFLDERLSGLSITNDNKFSFLEVKFKFYTRHPVWAHVRHSVSLAKLESYGPVLDIFGCHQHIDDE